MHIFPVWKTISVLSGSLFKGKDSKTPNRDRLKIRGSMVCQDFLLMHARTHSYVLVALLVMWIYFPLEQAHEWSLSWVGGIILRDLLLMLLIFGSWDWI